MAGLLPHAVTVSEATDAAFVDDRLAGPAAVGSGEAAAAELLALGRAPAKRREEFARARSCAHQALVGLGLPVTPVLIGRAGEPLWPKDVVGSITHCRGYRAAAVAPAHRFVAIGIDADRNVPLGPDVAAIVLTESERRALVRLPRWHNWDTVSFSAKESVFKAWFAVAGTSLAFGDVLLDIAPDPEDPRAGVFVVRLTGSTSGADVTMEPMNNGVVVGRYALTGRLVLTAVTVLRGS